jgi:methionyl-tRNA formyltransferase
MAKKIIFMGTPNFSVKTLEILANSKYNIKCVYTQPPKKSLRGQKINTSPVQKTAEKFNLEIRSPQSLNNKDEYEYFKSLKPYLVIVVAYGKIIPKNYLDLAEKGFLNIHASLLPKWRGAAPIQRSIMNNDKETGVSFMKIEEGLDTGPYMRQLRLKIDGQSSTEKITEELSELGAKNILKCIEMIENNQAQFVEQDHEKASYAKKINKLESKISWADKADKILYKINSLNPTPGAWFEYDGARYKIWKAEIKELNGIPGEILDEKLIIACKEKSIKILEIQKEGKNRLQIKDFLSGTKILIGTKLT